MLLRCPLISWSDKQVAGEALIFSRARRAEFLFFFYLNCLIHFISVDLFLWVLLPEL